MSTTVFPYGNSGDITVPAAEKIAVLGYSPIQVYQKVGYPNFPAQLELLTTTTPGEEYVSSAFTDGAVIVLENTGAGYGFYEVGAAPVVSEPFPDQTFADATGVIAGLAAAQGGSATLKGGTSSTSGNAGGAAALLGGQPGATGVGGAATVTGAAGGATSGKGGAVTLTGGAGTAGNGSGGSVILTPGAPHGSGLAGAVVNRGIFQLKRQAAPQTSTDTATLTAAKLLGGILAATPTAAANYTLPTGTDMKAALPTDLAAEDAFDLVVINLGGSGDDITFLVGADFTIVGNPVVTVAVPSQAQFRVRFVTGVTFILYRIA